MASEITYTDHGNLFLAAALNQMLHETIVDRTDLLETCTDWGSINGVGSQAYKVAKASFDDAMAAANTDEVTAIGNTDLGTGTVTITVARQALKRVVTDLYQLVGGPRPGIQRFAQDMADAAALRQTDMICALFGSLSNSVGTSGADLTCDDIYDAQYQLIQARVPGPYNCVLAPIQLTHFLDSLRGESGAVQFESATADMLGASGAGRKGTWHNIAFWDADSVATNGANKEGAMYGQGCFGYARGVPSDVVSMAGPGSFASVTPNGSPIFVEFERLAGEAHTLVVGNLYFGVSEIEDDRGVLISTSAT